MKTNTLQRLEPRVFLGKGEASQSTFRAEIRFDGNGQVAVFRMNGEQFEKPVEFEIVGEWELEEFADFVRKVSENKAFAREIK